MSRHSLPALVFVLLITTSIEAQFGEGFGGDGFVVRSLPEGTVVSESIMVVPSKSKKSVSGYSDSVGKWDRVKVEPHPKLGITPIVSSGVAVIKGKKHLYAFGEKTGKWATLEIGEAIDESEVVVHQNRATFLTETHFHVFSSYSGEWSSLDLTKD